MAKARAAKAEAQRRSEAAAREEAARKEALRVKRERVESKKRAKREKQAAAAKAKEQAEAKAKQIAEAKAKANAKAKVKVKAKAQAKQRSATGPNKRQEDTSITGVGGKDRGTATTDERPAKAKPVATATPTREAETKVDQVAPAAADNEQVEATTAERAVTNNEPTAPTTQNNGVDDAEILRLKELKAAQIQKHIRGRQARRLHRLRIAEQQQRQEEEEEEQRKQRKQREKLDAEQAAKVDLLQPTHIEEKGDEPALKPRSQDSKSKSSASSTTDAEQEAVVKATVAANIETKNASGEKGVAMRHEMREQIKQMYDEQETVAKETVAAAATSTRLQGVYKEQEGIAKATVTRGRIQHIYDEQETVAKAELEKSKTKTSTKLELKQIRNLYAQQEGIAKEVQEKRAATLLEATARMFLSFRKWPAVAKNLRKLKTLRRKLRSASAAAAEDLGLEGIEIKALQNGDQVVVRSPSPEKSKSGSLEIGRSRPRSGSVGGRARSASGAGHPDDPVFHVEDKMEKVMALNRALNEAVCDGLTRNDTDVKVAQLVVRVCFCTIHSIHSARVHSPSILCHRAFVFVVAVLEN